MAESILEIRHLRMLNALAEAGSVSRAAQRLHLTQSAVSHQLKALSEHYGVAVVKRHGQSVMLTQAGTRLVAAAKAVAHEIQAAERDVLRLISKPCGTLRIALECHTCFDWLMPIMDTFRGHWPEIELDLVSGFHSDPLSLLRDGRADLVIVSEAIRRRAIAYQPLFRFEILAVMSPEHRLRGKRILQAEDFSGETLITYPVPEDRIDVIRHVLKPAGVRFKRRTAELTVAILQLVASRRGIAALPSWGIKNYVDHDYVIARRIGAKGLWSDLYAATTKDMAAESYVQDFIAAAKTTCFATLNGLVALN
jgi:LysR family transcriptional regulator for metE and metH